MDLTINTDIVRLTGPANAIVIARIIWRCEREAARGARYMQYTDNLLATDTGLSRPAAQRARAWWCALGVAHCKSRGMPPQTEYDTHATLDSYRAWCAAQGIQLYETRAERVRRLEQRATDLRIDIRELQHDARAPHVARPDAYYEALLKQAIESRRAQLLAAS